MSERQSHECRNFRGFASDSPLAEIFHTESNYCYFKVTLKFYACYIVPGVRFKCCFLMEYDSC